MKLAAKIAATVIATALVSGVAGLAAQSAFADTATPPHSHATTITHNSKVGSPQYSQGFHIFNFTRYSMRLASVTGDGNFEGRPADGSILEPGQWADFEVTYKLFSNQEDKVQYDFIGPPGNATFTGDLTVWSGGGEKGTASSTYGIALRP